MFYLESVSVLLAESDVVEQRGRQPCLPRSSSAKSLWSWIYLMKKRKNKEYQVQNVLYDHHNHCNFMDDIEKCDRQTDWKTQWPRSALSRVTFATKNYSPIDLRTPCQARYVRCCGWDQKGVMATFSWRKTGPSTRGNLPSLQQRYDVPILLSICFCWSKIIEFHNRIC